MLSVMATEAVPSSFAADRITILSPGERSAPTIYLEALAEQVEQGLSLDAAMKQIAQIQVENHNRVPLDISVLENYDAIRPMLAVQMCDPETNQEYLKEKRPLQSERINRYLFCFWFQVIR